MTKTNILNYTKQILKYKFLHHACKHLIINNMR